MEIRKVFGLNGPNIWANSPVLEAWVDLGHFEELPTDKLPGFTERLMGTLPSLIEHRCSVGERGGFLSRLQNGTWLGHVLEHVTLELQTLTHADSGYGRARETPERGVYKVIVKCEDTRFAEHCMRTARELILACVDARAFALEPELARLRELADALCLGPSTRAIVQAAKARGIPFIRLTEGNLMQLGYGKAQRRIWTAETDRTSAVGEGIAQDKELTRRLLSAAGVPVPSGRVVKDAADAWQAAQDLAEPVVVKPVDANHGRGVSIRLDREDEVRAAFERAAREGTSVMVERFVPGTQHRVLVVGEQVVAAASGEADELVGDGTSTIRQLVEQANRDPRRGEESAKLLTPLELNDVALDLLRRQSFTSESVPQAGETVLMQYHGDLTVDVTDRLHPEVAAACVLAAQTVGLDIAGIDLIAADIGQPLQAQGAAVIEVNASPGLVAHLKPLSGKPRPVGEAIVGQLFAPGESGRVPIVAVSGTRQRQQVAQLVAGALTQQRAVVARADASGLYLGDRALQPGGPGADVGAARRALMNPAATAVVLEAPERVTLEQGLGFDHCQVAIVTTATELERSIRPGVDEAATIQKALRAPVDIVSRDGHAVLNAAEPLVFEMAEHCKGAVVLFGGAREESPVREHVDAGGAALVRLGSQLIWWSDRRRVTQLELPDWAESTQPSLVEPLMAAAAAVLALGVSAADFQRFLNKFNS
jgi:cyanophycin synthetase